jgi:hypothetical protein
LFFGVNKAYDCFMTVPQFGAGDDALANTFSNTSDERTRRLLVFLKHMKLSGPSTPKREDARHDLLRLLDHPTTSLVREIEQKWYGRR